MRAMQTIGRFMQIFSLVLLPAAMVVQLLNGISGSQLLVVLIFGGAMFYLGRTFEGIARADAEKSNRQRNSQRKS
jgi:hypothetical protein